MDIGAAQARRYLLQTQAIRSSEIDTVVFRPLLLASCFLCDDIVSYMPSYRNL
jgi:hypothetical protein